MEPNDGEKFSEFEPTNERTHRKERKKRISHPYICLDIKSVWFFVRRKTSFSLCDRERMGERMRMRQRYCVCALAFVHVCSCVWVCRIEYCFDVREIEKRWQKFYMLIWQCIVIWSCVCCVCVWVLDSALKLYAIGSNGCVLVCEAKELLRWHLYSAPRSHWLRQSFPPIVIK